MAGTPCCTQVLVAARENDELRASSPLAPLVAAVSKIVVQPAFVRDVRATISEENTVLVRAPLPPVHTAPHD